MWIGCVNGTVLGYKYTDPKRNAPVKPLDVKLIPKPCPIIKRPRTRKVTCETLVRISDKLKLVKAVNPKFYRSCGAPIHKYQLNPPLKRKTLEKYEKRWEVALPEELRTFLLELGNGGAGPGFGMFGIEGIACDVYGDTFREPFPFKRANRNAEEAMGTIAIADHGCGIMDVLVVVGPERGKMWVNDVANGVGFYPKGKTFLQWYESWLDWELRIFSVES